MYWLDFNGGCFMAAKDNKMNSIILIADTKITSIPVLDNQEPVIDIKNQHTISIGPSPEIANNIDYTHMRKSVYEKLQAAQALLPKGLRFCLYEGYRSLALQKILFDARFEKVKRTHPTWSESQIFDETTKLISPIINKDGSDNVPPHSTGAAVDVYLLNAQGERLDMGIHPKDWMQDHDGSLSLTASTKISLVAQQNRAIMNHALAAVGFVNYPTEYWHWSYGDRYWAYFMKKPHAIYGTVKLH